MLDDEIKEDHQLVTQLKGRGVDVICVRNAGDGEKVLEEDSEGFSKIMVVASDYRLEDEKDGLKIQQPIQGYRFLQNIINFDFSDNARIPIKPFVQLVALSALPRKFLMNSFGKYGMRVKVISKKDYFENAGTLNLLCDSLVELGNEQWEAAIRLPSLFSEQWKDFVQYYRYHRNSNEYAEREQEISEKAKAYCEGFPINTYPFKLEGYTALNFNAEGAQLEKSKSSDTNASEASPQEKASPEKEAKPKKKKQPEKDKYYKIFINKMICRRVVFWYSQKYASNNLQDIYKLIKGKDYTGNESLTTMKNQVYTNLALSLEDFPWTLTIEEKKWLVFEMGIKGIDELEEKESKIIDPIREMISEWIISSGLSQKLADIESLHKMVSENGDLLLYNFNSIKRFLYHLSSSIARNNAKIASMQSFIIELKKIFPEDFVSPNVEKFKPYLDKLRNERLPYLMDKGDGDKDVASDQGHRVDFNTILEWVTEKGIDLMGKDDLPGNACEFNNNPDIDKSKLKTADQWIKAIIDYHIKEEKKYYPNYKGFDETKGSGKKKGRGQQGKNDGEGDEEFGFSDNQDGE